MIPDDTFDRHILAILRHEGGFVDDPVDSKGATQFGISLCYLRELDPGDINGDVDAADIRQLTQAQAIEIYHRRQRAVD